MEWSQVFYAISGIFGTGGIGTYLLANQRIKHNKQVGELQLDQLRSEIDAVISKTQLQMIEAMRINMERSEARALSSDQHVAELTALLNLANQRIAKLELCIISNNLTIPL